MIKVELVNDLFLLEHRDFQSLNSKGFGKKDEGLYELEACEVLYLFEKGRIEVFEKNDNKLGAALRLNKDKKLSFKAILKRKKVLMQDYIVFKDLKSKGYNVKSGLKYGFRFRVYDKGIKVGQDHAKWLVEPTLETDTLKIKDLAGKNRVAHSTKKQVLLAIVDNEKGVTYLEIGWQKM